MCVFMCVSLYASCVCSDSGDQKRASEPRELELQAVEGCPVGAENQIPVLWESSTYSLLQSHLPGSTPSFLRKEKSPEMFC